MADISKPTCRNTLSTTAMLRNQCGHRHNGRPQMDTTWQPGLRGRVRGAEALHELPMACHHSSSLAWGASGPAPAPAAAPVAAWRQPRLQPQSQLGVNLGPPCLKRIDF